MSTRRETIQKLGRAIKEYRGSKNIVTGKWYRHPKPHERTRIQIYLSRLGLPVEETLKKIDAFAHGNEYRAWIKQLSENEPTTSQAST